MNDRVQPSAAVIARIEQYLGERVGWRLREERLSAFVAALARRWRQSGSPSYESYCARLLTEAGDSETTALVEELAVGESYFRRVPAVFDCLGQQLIPELLRRKRAGGDRRLRIWSAACAAGEEPYSVAITLLLSNVTAADWDIEIRATDVSHQALRRAREGRFRRWSFRAIDEGSAFRRYFSQRDDELEISPEVRAMVTFERFNLMAPSYPRARDGGLWDLILLRNVLIYFTAEKTEAALAKASAAITEDGALLLGECEILDPLVDSFVRDEVAGVSVYRKTTPARPPWRPTRMVSAHPIGAQLLRAPQRRLGSGRPSPPARPEVTRAPPPCDVTPASTTRLVGVGSARDQAHHLTARRHFQAGDHATARALLDAILTEDSQDSEARLLRAALSLLEGSPETARADCERVVRHDALVAGAHLLLGVVAYEQGDVARAHDDLRRALFLDADLALGHFFMGRVRDLLGDDRAAAASYRRALAQARQFEGEDLGLGITPEALTKAVITRLQAGSAGDE